MKRPHCLVVSMALFANSSACTVSLDVPTETKIECAQDSDCPGSYVCAPALGACVPGQGSSSLGPKVVGEVSISKSPANATDIVTVAFAVDQQLGLEPRLYLGDGAQTPWRYDGETQGRHQFSLIASSAAHGVWSLLATLVGANGAVSSDLNIGTIELDFQAPRLAGLAVVNPPVMGPSGTLIAITSDEDLDIPPTVSVRWDETTSVALIADATTNPRTFSYTYVPTTEEPEQGSGTIEVRLEDPAGNATEDNAGRVDADFRGPVLLPGFASRRLVPGAGNPLQTVAEVGLGTTVELFIAFDEPVVAGTEGYPLVRTLDTNLHFVERLHAGTTYVYELVLTAGQGSEPGGAYRQGQETVEIVARDELGNQSITVLDEAALRFTVDTLAPDEPDVLHDSRIVYHRWPWGDARGPIPRFGIRLDASAVEADALVRIFTPTGVLIDERVAGADGDLNGGALLDLPILDLATVTISVIDSAGNASDSDAGTQGAQPTEAMQVAWHASMGAKVAGSDAENPHSFWAFGASDSRLIVDDEIPYGERHGIAQASEGEGVSTDGTAMWRHVFSTALPSRRLLPSVAYDVQRGELMLMGGQSTGMEVGQIIVRTRRELSDAWIRSGQRWVPRTPDDANGDGNPSRLHHLFAYDPSRGVSYLAPLAQEETWQFDGWNWINLGVASNLPAFGTRALVYDPARQRVVLFSGDGGELSIYSFDGSEWEAACVDACVANPRPAPTLYFNGAKTFSVTYDEAREQFLYFGDGQTWTWQGDQAWVQQCVACDPLPASRREASLIYDSRHGRVVLYGGCVPGEHRANGCDESYVDTWLWDGSAWSCQSDDLECGGGLCLEGVPVDACNTVYPTPLNAFIGTLPGATPLHGSGATFVYDSGADEVVLIGGQGSLPSMSMDPSYPWVWKGTSWQQRTHSAPSDRPTMASFEHASGSGVLLFTGGQSWVWNGRSWSLSCTDPDTCTPPAARSGHAMTYDPTTGGVLLFGGEIGGTAQCDLWHWDPASQWQKLAPAADCPTVQNDTEPMAHAKPRMTYDDSLHGVLLTAATEWQWKDDAWLHLCTAPCAVPGTTTERGPLFYDPLAPGVFTQGGLDTGIGERTISDTWHYDGVWSQVGTGPRRSNHSILRDRARNVVMLFGGDSIDTACVHCGESYYDDVLLRTSDGSWQDGLHVETILDGAPGPHRYHGAAYDPVTKGVLIHGGNGGAAGVDYDDSWLWDGGADGHPVHKLGVTASVAGVDGATIKGIGAEWIGGGVGYPAGTQEPGFELRVWTSTGWRSAGAISAAGPDMPDALSWDSREDLNWQSMNSDAYRRLFVGRKQALTIAAIPVAPNGTFPHYGRLHTDYVEAIVFYRR